MGLFKRQTPVGMPDAAALNDPGRALRHKSGFGEASSLASPSCGVVVHLDRPSASQSRKGARTMRRFPAR